MRTKEKPQKEIIQDPRKRRTWVKYQIHLQGMSMARLAADHGVTRNCLYVAFDRPYPRMERVLADAVGLTPQALFPERYDALGLPNRPRGRPEKYSPKDTERRQARNAKRGSSRANERPLEH